MDARRVVSLSLYASPQLPARWRPCPPPHGGSAREASLRSVDGLIFNLRNVLFDDTAWRRWLLRLVHHMGLHTHYEAFFRLWEHEFLPAVRSGRLEYWDAFGRYLLQTGMNRGQVAEVEAAGRLRRERFNQQTRPFPGVGRTLARLHQAGLRLVVVDPGGGEITDPVQPLRDGGLERWFHAVFPEQDRRQPPGRENQGVAGQASGFDTDDRSQKYQQALATMRLPAQRVALVGQDPQELQTAAALGIQCIAFNAGRDIDACCHLDQFADLPALCRVECMQRLAG
jgi:phosphoglycolate phosphatase-like HAD superfamily hydrolase